MDLTLWVSSTVFSWFHAVGSCPEPVGLICTVQFCENGYVAAGHHFAGGIKVLWMVFRAQASSWTLCIPFCVGQMPFPRGSVASLALAPRTTHESTGEVWVGKWRAGRGKEDSSVTQWGRDRCGKGRPFISSSSFRIWPQDWAAVLFWHLNSLQVSSHRNKTSKVQLCSSSMTAEGFYVPAPL